MPSGSIAAAASFPSFQVCHGGAEWGQDSLTKGPGREPNKTIQELCPAPASSAKTAPRDSSGAGRYKAVEDRGKSACYVRLSALI